VGVAFRVERACVRDRGFVERGHRKLMSVLVVPTDAHAPSGGDPARELDPAMSAARAIRLQVATTGDGTRCPTRDDRGVTEIAKAGGSGRGSTLQGGIRSCEGHARDMHRSRSSIYRGGAERDGSAGCVCTAVTAIMW
jgi:hypothetical protein